MGGKSKFMYRSSGMRAVNFSDIMPVLSEIACMAFDKSSNYSVK